MGLIIAILVFVGVFTLIALPLVAVGTLQQRQAGSGHAGLGN